MSIFALGDNNAYGKINGVFNAEEKLVKFELISTRDRHILGNFIGELDSFGGFKLLRGTFTEIRGEDTIDWTLTVTGLRVGRVSEYIIGKNDNIELIKIDENLAIKEMDVDEEISFYVKPVKISKRKIFGLIPYGEKFVDVEVTKKGKTFTKRIFEFSQEIFEGHNIRVGSLQDVENIEFDITKAP